MKFKGLKRINSWLLCVMLIVAMAFTIVGCGEKENDEGQKSTEAQDNTGAKKSVLGEGDTKFIFTVVDGEGKETEFEVNTDKKTVGEALLDVELIDGESGEYGLYVKKVNGITADYDKDKTYWAFYVDGEYAMTGVDLTDIEEGKTYSFKLEK